MNHPIHVVFFNRAFYPEISGTSQFLTELAEDLVRVHGCRVSIVAGQPIGVREDAWSPPKGWGLVQEEQYHGVSVLRGWNTSLDKHSFLGRALNYLSYCFSACLAAFRLPRPDIIVTLTDPPIIGWVALLASKWFRCPLVVWYQDLFPEVARLLNRPISPLVEWVLNRTNQVLIRQAARVVALGPAMRKRLVEEKGVAPERLCVFPVWSDCKAVVPGPRRNAFSERHDLVDAFVVMYSGNVGTSQELAALVEAAALLKDIDDLVVLIVGDGVQKVALQAQVEQRKLGNVRFLPYQPAEHLGEAFASADCFVISLKAGLEGYIMPSKLFGVLASGRPFVGAVADGCDVAGVVRRYNCGFLAEPGNPQALAEKVRLLYEDRDLLKQFGINARKAALDFDRPIGVRRYFELFKELAKDDGDLCAAS